LPISSTLFGTLTVNYLTTSAAVRKSSAKNRRSLAGPRVLWERP
jgi:hypothetical protein